MRTLAVMSTLLLLISCGSQQQSGSQEWIQLFNGKDLNDWSVKIKGYRLNDNFRNIFRVEDGIMKVRYEGFDTFRDEFGHIFYKNPFSRYKLRIEYRFTGDQVPGAPSWAYRNSGVMLHSQSPESMGVDQDFPVSVEAQFLGGDGVNERSTGNVCTPGTYIVMGGELITQHCISSSSRTYHGDVWVKAEFVVLGDTVIHHIIEGDTVLTYFRPQVGGAPEGYPVPEGTLLNRGYICLQAESHPVEFRKVELLDLSKGKKSK